MRIGVCVVSAVLCAACQTYQNVAMERLAPNNDVRVTFTAEGSTDVVRLVGPRVSAVEGRIVSVDSQSVRIAVRDLVRTDGSFNMYHDEVVAIPRNDIATTEVKRVSTARSLVTAGALVAGSVVAATQLGNGESGRHGAAGGGTTTK